MCVSETECSGLHKSGDGAGVHPRTTPLHVAVYPASLLDLWPKWATFTQSVLSPPQLTTNSFITRCKGEVLRGCRYTAGWINREKTSLNSSLFSISSVKLFLPADATGRLIVHATPTKCFILQIHPACQSICVSFHLSICPQIEK